MAFPLVLSPRRARLLSAALAAALAEGAARAEPPPGGGAPAPGSSWASPSGSASTPTPPASAGPPAEAPPSAGAAGAGSAGSAGTGAGAMGTGAAGEAKAGGTATPPKNEAPVVVAVRAEGRELDASNVRAEIARELGVPATAPEGAPSVTRGTVTVTWRAMTRELVVGFQHPERGNLTRVVDAPEGQAELAHAAALLAGNLARDQEGNVAGPTSSEAPVALPASSKAAVVHVSLFHPIATNRDTPRATVNASFNFIYGRVGGLDGAQLGVINVVAGEAKGAQLALGWNWVRGGLSGFQGSLLGFNVAGGKVDAWQLAPGFNYAGGEVRGAQIGSVNVAGDLRGAQVGFVNVGGKVKGVQVGLINVADDVEGAPIGLVSVTKSGGVHPTVWASSTTYGNAGLKFATRYTYTMASAAYHEDGGRNFAGGGATIGAQIPFDQTRFSFDLQYLFLYDTGPCSAAAGVPCGGDGRDRQRHLGKARFSAGYRFQPHLGIFLGAGATLDARRVNVEVDTGRGFGRSDARFRWHPEFFGGLEF
jgi:hypothetical protein